MFSNLGTWSFLNRVVRSKSKHNNFGVDSLVVCQEHQMLLSIILRNAAQNDVCFFLNISSSFFNIFPGHAFPDEYTRLEKSLSDARW